MSSERPVLYSYFSSSCSYCVRIALNLKGIEYDYVPINLVKNEQRSDEYLELNPSGAVPTLKINGNILTQSISIMEYLDEAFPNAHRLLPKDDIIKRASVRQLSLLISADTQQVQSLTRLKFIKGERKLQLGYWAIGRRLHAFEKFLKQTAGKYCVGDEITMADICLVAQMIINASKFFDDISDFPIIQRIIEELMKHDAFQKANPLEQPDCTDELIEKEKLKKK